MMRGTQPTLHVITTGLLLRALDGVPNPDPLLEKMSNAQPDAVAGLTAQYLLISADSQMAVKQSSALAAGALGDGIGVCPALRTIGSVSTGVTALGIVPALRSVRPVAVTTPEMSSQVDPCILGLAALVGG